MSANKTESFGLRMLGLPSKIDDGPYKELVKMLVPNPSAIKPNSSEAFVQKVRKALAFDLPGAAAPKRSQSQAALDKPTAEPQTSKETQARQEGNKAES